MFLNTSCVLILDDNDSDAKPLVNYFSNLAVPYIRITGQEGVQSKIQTRIVFADLHIDSTVTGDAAMISKVFTVLEDRIDKDHGPILLIIWSTHQELVAELEKKKSVCDLDILHISQIDKQKVLDIIKGGGCANSFIESEVKKSVSSQPEIELVNAWESCVQKSISIQFKKMLGTERTEVPAFLSLLGKSYVSQNVYDKLNPREKSKAISQALSSILVDSIHEDLSISDQSLFPEWGDVKGSPGFFEKFDDVRNGFLYSKDVASEETWSPGSVFKVEEPNVIFDNVLASENWKHDCLYEILNDQKCISMLRSELLNYNKGEVPEVLKEVINLVPPDEQCYNCKKALSDEAIVKNEKSDFIKFLYRFFSTILLDKKLNTSEIDIVVFEKSPVCDHAQSKRKVLDFCVGYMFPSDLISFIGGSDAPLKMSDIVFEGKTLVLDKSLCISMSKNASDKLSKMKFLFKVKQGILASIQNQVGAFRTRQGYLKIESFEDDE